MESASQIKLKKALIALLILIVVFQLNLDKINPNVFIFYQLKRVQEKVYLALKPGVAAKAAYLQVLLDYRLKEMENAARGNDLGQIAAASSRYSTTAGELTNLILENNLIEKANLSLAQFKNHEAKIKEAHDEILNKFGVIPTLEQRKQLQVSLDALGIYSQTLLILK